MRTLKFKERVEKFKEIFAKKTIRQKIWFCIGLTFLLIFLFFIIKGNTYDLWVSENAQTSQTENIAPGSSNYSDNSTDTQNESTPSKKAPTFKINWLDVVILAVLCTVYGVHKIRENKRNGR